MVVLRYKETPRETIFTILVKQWGQKYQINESCFEWYLNLQLELNDLFMESSLLIT